MGFSPTGEGGAGGGLPPFQLPPISGGGGGGASTSSVTVALQQIINYVTAWGTYGQQFLGGALSAIKSVLSSIVAQAVNLFRYFQQTWFGQIVKGIWAKLKTIFAAVQKQIKQIMTIVQAYEKLVRYWEQRILGPAINLIQALRKTLVVFRLFHIKQAQQLDNYLSGVEGRLTNIFLWYQRELNYIIDALNFIVDPWGLLSEALLIKSAVRSIGAVWAGVVGYPSSSTTAAQNTAAQSRTQFYTHAQQHTYMNGLAAGGTNPDDQAIIELQKQGYAELGVNS